MRGGHPELNLPRHVLMTTDTVGGVWTWSTQWARILSELGVRVTLVAWGEPPETVSRPNLEVVVGASCLEWMAEPWGEIDRAGDWLLTVSEEKNPDLIHLTDFSYGALPLRAPKVVVAHSDVLSWWQSVIGGAAPT